MPTDLPPPRQEPLPLYLVKCVIAEAIAWTLILRFWTFKPLAWAGFRVLQASAAVRRVVPLGWLLMQLAKGLMALAFWIRPARPL